MSAPNTSGRAGIEEIIGNQMAQDANPTQYAELEHFANEASGRHINGIKRQARDVQREVDRGNLTAGVPALLYRLRKGRHKQSTPAERSNLSHLDEAHRLYLAKMKHFDQHDAWSQGWTQLDAIAYAIDFTHPGDKALEDELRVLVGLEPYPVASNAWAKPRIATLSNDDYSKQLAAIGTTLPEPPPLDDDDIPGYGDTT